MKKILLGFITISMLIFVTGCDTEEEYANLPSGVYDLTVNEDTIKETYLNNVLDGNKKYFGKRLKVSSNYESISDGTLSGIMLYMNNIYCSSFNSENDTALLSELNYGQSITIIGTADEWVSSKLNLKDCEIILD